MRAAGIAGCGGVILLHSVYGTSSKFEMVASISQARPGDGGYGAGA